MWVHQLQSPDLLEKLMAELNKKQGGAKEIDASKSEKGKKRREFCKFGTASFMSEESSSEEEEALKVNEPASSVGKELGRAFRSELRIERRSKSHRPMKTQGTVLGNVRLLKMGTFQSPNLPALFLRSWWQSWLV